MENLDLHRRNSLEYFIKISAGIIFFSGKSAICWTDLTTPNRLMSNVNLTDKEGDDRE